MICGDNDKIPLGMKIFLWMKGSKNKKSFKEMGKNAR
jgi:hypothetical protein